MLARSETARSYDHSSGLKTLKYLFIIISLFVPAFANAELATGKAEKNSLYDHASPYLAMHGKDPVKWQPWNQQTISIARQQDKLLFVSSGYFSCHWCHVMQRESFQNDKVAALLNSQFVPVKVDRELNSALDTHLIDFVEKTQGQAGWPLNVFITPDGYPLVGFTYAPPENVSQILTALQKEWRTKKQELKDLARTASVELSKAEVSQQARLPDDIAEGMSDVFVSQTFTYADDLQGGFGQQNKFPSVPKLQTLLTIYQQTRNQQIKQYLQLTLHNMASQGLHDQLGGGFYRYVVDPAWQVPHFEKMLYDNALLASLYFQAARILGEPAYKKIAEQTLDFILLELTTTLPAFAASLSAVDDKGIEGGYYLWHVDDLKLLLTADELKAVSLFWGLEGGPDLDDGHHLVQMISLDELAKQLQRSVSDSASLIESARKKMLNTRSKRVLPKDDKILTAWNGLTLSALVAGAQHSNKPEYQQAAKRLVSYIHNQLWNNNSKTLRRAIGKHGAIGEGGLEEYAYVAEGLLAWWQLVNNPRDKALLEAVLDQAWRRFYGPQGWQLAENMLLKYGTGQTMVSDGSLPSPSAVLIETTYRYALLTNHVNLKQQALKALNVGFNQLQADAFWHATQIRALLSVQK